MVYLKNLTVDLMNYPEDKGKVGMARAIIKKPLLLLADEPVASLDPKSSNLILSLLNK